MGERAGVRPRVWGLAEPIVQCGWAETGRQCTLGRRLAAAIAAIAFCFGVAGCSPGADYPSLFPAVHDMPPPRADAPLTPVQVQQATEDLITERDRLTAEAQAADQKGAEANAPQAAKYGAAGQAAAGTNGVTQTAGADSK